MPRNTFLDIKKHIRYSRNNEKNDSDKVWRVRTITEIFQTNCQQFSYFSANLSVDESMIRFKGRCQIRQFMKNKPIRFGIKTWSLCTHFGFLLNFNIYCGKNSTDSSEKLNKCTLGTRVVMNLLQPFLRETPMEELEKFHVVFDNFFTSPDLLVHLKTIGLRATGMVRSNRVHEQKLIDNKLTRVTVPITINNKSKRGDYEVKREINSNLNYVSVKDSKVVSILSTAAGIQEPFKEMERFSNEEKKKISVPFPQCIATYNSYMGGVDTHDQYRNDLRININSKKWTWQIFKYIIESSLSNAIILHNICVEKEFKVKTQDFAMHIANEYLRREEKNVYPNHSAYSVPLIRVCKACSKDTAHYCFDCKSHICLICFEDTHFIVHKVVSTKKRGNCYCEQCTVRTTLCCEKCDKFVCKKCSPQHRKKK